MGVKQKGFMLYSSTQKVREHKVLVVFQLTILLSVAALASSEDSFRYLEDLGSPKSLEWVKGQNQITEQRLKSTSSFERFQQEALKILSSPDRVATPQIIGESVFNFWQDEKSSRGLLRKTSINSYLSSETEWETVLDIDKLSRDEGQAWVFKAIDCLPAPEEHRCLVSLSPKGGDDTVVREFDVASKAFVTVDGFTIPLAKTYASWLDKQTLIVGTRWNSNNETLTASGYPKVLRLWKRGTPLEQATTIFEGSKSDVFVRALVGRSSDTKRPVVIGRFLDIFNLEVFEYRDNTVVKLPLPTRIKVSGLLNDLFIISLSSDWTHKGRLFKSGSLVSFNLATQEILPIFEPTPSVILNGTAIAKDSVYVSMLNNVNGSVYQARLARSGAWTLRSVALPRLGSIALVTSDPQSPTIFASYTSFLVPNRLFSIRGVGSKLEVRQAKKSPSFFDERRFESTQRFATSADGTRVPYFVVYPKDHLFKPGPTYLTGYGGFQIPSLPAYSGVVGKLWLEEGGKYVLANIRGGGEFGPQWHQAATLQNKRKSFEDFVAVAEDLVKSKITAPRSLGISGSSNGGLLVAAVTMMRPELFSAVFCNLPLLDMIRYRELFAGPSWTAEYGDPRDSKMKEYLLGYSPYHNVQLGKTYPEIFLSAFASDNRVHPGHARKMAAKLQSLGYSALYFESNEGGHGSGVTLHQRAAFTAMQYSYFREKLFNQSRRD